MPAKKVSPEQGFMFIEILVALSILAIVIVAFTAVFTTGFAGIFSVGQTGGSFYSAQEAMENTAAGVEYEGVHAGNIDIHPVEYYPLESPFTLHFADLGYTVSVVGKTYRVVYDEGGRSVTLMTFVPD